MKTLIKKTLSQPFICILFALSLSPSSIAGSIAPDFTGKTMAGDNLRLQEQQGNVVMLNFWASWCGPCRKEMPLLEDMQKKYQRMGFTLIGVNVDEDTQAAKRFLADVKTSFPMVLDASGTISKQYNVDAMPTSIFIDRSGNIRDVHKGYKAGDEKAYEKILKKLIRE